MIGREREMRVLDDLVDDVAEHGAGLVVRGEAGIGKSALLAAATSHAQARGMLVLTTAGVQSESQLAFAGLHQLLRPILAAANELWDRQRDALLAAFGMIAAPAPDRFLIALAVLELLAAVAARTPLLVIVEDVEWLDRCTCDVLMFLARRLESNPIVLLLSLRNGFHSELGEPGLPEMSLEGLDPSSAATLLDEHAPNLAATVRERILLDSAGNPLAILELPIALKSEHLDSGEPLPSNLPLTARLERAFGARVA
ncbi:MAG TPA: ATP-binding protein [Ktedonobacterales bacterium]|nr:ATP-binding protein [Ktedonobacterales bacterium]